ncbi:hypothetical protein ABZZ20_24430 [Streptomyces sp. NPDC006430]|uniref:hypothetical protein n=1 Tax=Streptomyces sp. NPDC006430 TaxID=3154299 RepID=UPI0033AC53EF
MTVRGTDGAGGTLSGVSRRLVLAVDAKGYGRAAAPLQRQYQEGIPLVLGRAAEAAGLDRDRWMRQFAGDSEFAVLPEGASEPALVDRFMRSLEAELRAFNGTRLRGAWLELRAAVHVGLVSAGANGVIGEVPVEVGRILDSAPLRAALAGVEDACLAVALSPTLFNDVVAQEYTTIRVAECREVRVRAKEHDGRAWIWVPGHDIRGLDLDPGTGAGPTESGEEPPAAAPPDGQGPDGGAGERPGPVRGEGPGREGDPAPARDQVVQHFHGSVHAAGAVFGISR